MASGPPVAPWALRKVVLWHVAHVAWAEPVAVFTTVPIAFAVCVASP